MSESIESLLDLYARCYSEGNLKGIVSLCVTPFFAVRRGEVMAMLDEGAVLTHFSAAVDAYRRASDARTWSPSEVTTVELGEYSALATVNWKASDANGQVVRDTWTTLATAEALYSIGSIGYS